MADNSNKPHWVDLTGLFLAIILAYSSSEFRGFCIEICKTARDRIYELFFVGQQSGVSAAPSKKRKKKPGKSASPSNDKLNENRSNESLTSQDDSLSAGEMCYDSINEPENSTSSSTITNPNNEQKNQPEIRVPDPDPVEGLNFGKR